MSGELSRLSPPKGATRRHKHKGRGPASGNGKTAGRGQKGQKARKSGHVRLGFEGGSMPLQRRLPKRGFKNIFAKNWAEVSLRRLNTFADGDTVNIDTLREKRLVQGRPDGVKLIGSEGLERKLTVNVNRISKGARAAVEGKGGSVDLIADKPKWRRTNDRTSKRAAAKS